MIRQKVYDKYRAPRGVAAWQARCQLTNEQAALALHLPRRSWFRWKALGLPLGAPGWIGAIALFCIERDLTCLPRDRQKKKAGISPGLSLRKGD